MMESDSAEGGSYWSRIRSCISRTCGDLFRAQSQTNQSSVWQACSQGWVPGQVSSTTDVSAPDVITWTTDNTGGIIPLTVPPFQVHATPASGIWSFEPVTKKCNYCGQETPDFRELRIGRLTTVVVCDMCMLKALSKSLEVPDGGGDEGSRGSPGDDEHKPGTEGP